MSGHYNELTAAAICVKQVPSESQQKPLTQAPSHCESLWQARRAQAPALQSPRTLQIGFVAGQSVLVAQAVQFVPSHTLAIAASADGTGHSPLVVHGEPLPWGA